MAGNAYIINNRVSNSKAYSSNNGLTIKSNDSITDGKEGGYNTNGN